MFGKKLVVGYLVDKDRTLLKEFLFSPKADVTYDDILKATEGKGDLAALGAFEVDKYVGNIVTGDDIHFIIVSRDVVEDDETEFFKYMLTSAESRFSEALEERLSKANEAEQLPPECYARTLLVVAGQFCGHGGVRDLDQGPAQGHGQIPAEQVGEASLRVWVVQKPGTGGDDQ